MVARRQFSIGAAATLLCVPSIVQAPSLMPLRGVIFPVERNYYGFLERLYVQANLPAIMAFQNAGLSAHQVAAAMNGRRRRSINDADWDAERVIGLLSRDRKICREDTVSGGENARSIGEGLLEDLAVALNSRLVSAS